MQQLLSAFGIDWRLLLAQAVNFGIVLAALWYFLYKPVLRILEERRRVVAKGVEDAKQAAVTLAGAGDEATKRLRAAEHEAEDVMTRAREAAESEKERIVKAAEARAAAALKDAEARATAEAARLKRESEKDIAYTAVLMAEKVLRKRHD
ncbi:MAG TPA: ATP synthase F0 subunit B [Candidatus Paceibacterota bacterium]|nr:ATP synthase F0 subunit B [Candidatus Paceibacterota bacterium]